MTVSIPSEFERFISAQVASGKYSRPEDVLSDALALLRDESELHEAIRAGVEEVERGDIVDAETAHRELRTFIQDIMLRNAEMDAGLNIGRPHDEVIAAARQAIQRK